MKKAILIAILLLAAARPSSAQALTEYGQARNVVIDGDTVVLIQLSPSFVFRKAVDTRRFARLIYNLKRVYPIAKEANATLHAMEAHMETLATKREKQIFVKEMERALKKKYTPVLKKIDPLTRQTADQADRPGDGPDLLRTGQGTPGRLSRVFLAKHRTAVRRQPQGHVRQGRRRHDGRGTDQAVRGRASLSEKLSLEPETVFA